VINRQPRGRSAIPRDLLPDGVVTAHPIAVGHIHTTWKVLDDRGGRWAVQALARSIFDDLDALTHNLEIVTGALRRAGLATIEPAEVGPDRTLTLEVDARVWRASRWIEGRPPTAGDLDDARLVGETFGRFDAALSGVDGLVEVIPDFHDPGRRFRLLDSALAADPVDRAAAAAVLARRLHEVQTRIFGEIAYWRRLPRRVVHNDAKAANAIITPTSGAVVIDVDTVMPGTVLSDIGELVRSAVRSTEDTTTTEPVDVSLVGEIAAGFADGFGPLDPAEIRLAPWAGLILTVENAVRFHFVAGDVYFDVGTSDHNLRRAEDQVDLAERLEASMSEITDVVGTSIGS